MDGGSLVHGGGDLGDFLEVAMEAEMISRAQAAWIEIGGYLIICAIMYAFAMALAWTLVGIINTISAILRLEERLKRSFDDYMRWGPRSGWDKLREQAREKK